jgi:Flp pilus assembly protein protease CpaA
VFGLVATTAGVADFVARDVAARVVVVVVVVSFVVLVVSSWGPALT